VLASPAFLQRVALFSPARLQSPPPSIRVGLKGAGDSANPDDASTATSEASEERSESREFCERSEQNLERRAEASLSVAETPGAFEIVPVSSAYLNTTTAAGRPDSG